MNSDSIKNLENNVNRAIQTIGSLKDEKNKLKKEIESLSRQNEGLLKQIEELKLELSAKLESPSALPSGFDVQAVKTRLEKLAVKLAALEDSWN
jgi:chromosome segregation ATPase